MVKKTGALNGYTRIEASKDGCGDDGKTDRKISDGSGRKQRLDIISTGTTSTIGRPSNERIDTSLEIAIGKLADLFQNLLSTKNEGERSYIIKQIKLQIEKEGFSDSEVSHAKCGAFLYDASIYGKNGNVEGKKLQKKLEELDSLCPSLAKEITSSVKRVKEKARVYGIAHSEIESLISTPVSGKNATAQQIIDGAISNAKGADFTSEVINDIKSALKSVQDKLRTCLSKFCAQNVVSVASNRPNVKGEEQLSAVAKKCGRTVGEASGRNNWCGYLSVLSQIDPSFGGDVTSNNEIGSRETAQKVSQLKLAVAIGKAIENPAIIAERGGFAAYLESQTCNVGMMYEDSLRFIAAGLGRPIALIEHGASGGMSGLRKFNAEGSFEFFAPEIVDDAYVDAVKRNETDKANEIMERGNVTTGGTKYYTGSRNVKTEIENALSDEKAIVLINRNGNHFVPAPVVTKPNQQ
ncbi:MAG: hypothetical protein LBB18_03095 [Puniceicoccales bacterium]|nr:hypothetical protein [Puniceicoccales bacterium]